MTEVTTDITTAVQPEIEWDHTGFFLLNDAPFEPKVWDTTLSEERPEEINTVLLSLDATLDSNFDWNEVKSRAQSFVEEGLYLIWDLDLGLFDRLKLPLYHEGQCQSLVLAIRHFTEKFYPAFEASTIGACLFRGKMDLSWEFRWDAEHLANFHLWRKERLASSVEKSPVALSETKEGRQELCLFCRDVSLDLIEVLSAHLPGGVIPFVFLDAEDLDDNISRMQYLLPDRFEHVLAVTNCEHFPMSGMRWRQGSASWEFAAYHEEAVGVMLPAYHDFNDYAWEEVGKRLESLESYRFVAETFLIQQWMGLDRLIVSQKGLGYQVERQVQGFIAAGGEVERVEGD